MNKQRRQLHFHKLACAESKETGSRALHHNHRASAENNDKAFSISHGVLLS